MLSDDEILGLWSWASGQDQGPETTQQHAFARAVERAAYERAAALVIEMREDHVVADAIRALGRQND